MIYGIKTCQERRKLDNKSCPKKIFILPGGFNHLGGTLISLLGLIQGFEKCGFSEQLCILVWSDSFTEKYLRDTGYTSCIQLIAAKNEFEFMKQALRWVGQQPKDYPLLLDNWSNLYILLSSLRFTAIIRLSGRPIYHFCHDLTCSYNLLGELLRKIAFACLNPKAICNSQFTVGHIRRLMPNIQGILYQPVDTERFNDHLNYGSPPVNLQPILNSGARIILTPSRLNKPRIVNDKNLRSLIPVLTHLKAMGHFYHGVVIGPDESDDGSYTRELLENAAQQGVADRFTILPATLNIENYYKYASVVVTLAPREPFGRTVVEAIACGIPVIGSSTGGINEILQHFASEWTVDPNNPIAVAEAIIRVVSDTNTPTLLAKGKAWVETNCNVANYAQKMMQLTGL
ncbi:MAG: glycosyltransferase family 4 protein [Rhizonema sp. PD37]|nr:glycosyltransferase family 4 protein [Rhizonema sp. PD37]